MTLDPAARPVRTPPEPASEGSGGTETGTGSPAVLTIDDERASDRALCGGKAAALAKAKICGLPVLPGFVIVTEAAEEIHSNGWSGATSEHVRTAWKELSEEGARALVVRSSSTAEDLQGSSMAGRFRSVVGARGWDDFRHAVGTVLESRRQAAAGDSPPRPDQAIAVLVQPVLEARSGGVMFGVDPVTGRSDRIVVSAVTGAPDKLVSGEVEGTRYEIDKTGTVQSRFEGGSGARLRRRELRSLAALAGEVAKTFGGPQDVEWGVDGKGALWLLQSRPVTTEVRGAPVGPVFGPGPISETFPEPLAPLEEDLWLEPLKSALGAALRLSGAASPRQVGSSPIVVSVDGRPAVDLELFGEEEGTLSFGRRLDPRPRLRRLRAAWRVGRLRVALSDLARDLVERTDVELLRVPPLNDLSDVQLVVMLERCRQALTALHGHEVLMGLVVDPGAPQVTAARLALEVLAHGREQGLPDGELAKRYPVVLALVPPRIQPTAPLPGVEEPSAPAVEGNEDGDTAAVLREALRLRARWVQELSGRAAWLLGQRLAESGVLAETVLVRELRLDELAAEVLDGEGLRRPPPRATARLEIEPLPARFRLSDSGRPVPVVVASRRAGTGAGGGRGTGKVHQGGDPPQGAVLVVPTLDPAVASVLPRLAGLVAETGSVLAHIAILAREAGIPTVVGLPDATERFRPGVVLRVDGDSGEVVIVNEEEER